MSEKLHAGPEHKTGQLDTSAELKELQRNLEAAANSSPESDQHSTEELSHKAEQEALSGKEFTIGDRKETSDTPIGHQKELKSISYKRTMSRVQSQLSTPERTFSKVIHQPVIEKVSDVGARTVGRPSGLLGGGVASLIGTGFVLYVARHYGFEYNYMLFILLFAVGFFAGIVIELTTKLLQKQNS
jgi:hypothetical protein